MAARICALAKSPKSLQMDFTSQSPVTSGHCTVWQKHGHDAGSEHCYAPTPVASMSKWISGCYASCHGKNLSCSTTHSTGCTYKSSVRLRDLTSVTCYTRLKRELTRSGYALYTQVCACDNTTRHNKAKQKLKDTFKAPGSPFYANRT